MRSRGADELPPRDFVIKHRHGRIGSICKLSGFENAEPAQCDAATNTPRRAGHNSDTACSHCIRRRDQAERRRTAAVETLEFLNSFARCVAMVASRETCSSETSRILSDAHSMIRIERGG